MNISEAIHSIVKKRESVKGAFSKLKTEVDNIKQFCDEANKWLTNADWQYYLDSLDENHDLRITIPSIQADIMKLQENVEKLSSSDSHKVGDLDRVVNRIMRDEFNFCFMGAWRQGKSFVLDRLLDMGEYIMPTSDLDATTGTVVSVRNNENPKYSEAKILYYTVEDMVEKIKGYINYFNLGVSFEVDTSSPNLEVVRNNFAHACHSLRYATPNFDGNTHKQQLFDTFEKLIHKVDLYKDSLGRSGEMPLVLMNEGVDNIANLEILRKKICFFDINKQPCYEVFAVKKVEVAKYFKIGNEDVGPVMFTDTCGIGEYRLGIDEELQKVLLCDSDIAVAVAKVPDDDTTIDKLATFHDTIFPVLSGRDSGKWVYYLINRKDNIDYKRSEEFKGKIESSLGKLGLYLPSKNYQIVQASKKDKVYDFILNNILTPVAENIESVDNALFSKTFDEANDVIKQYKKIKETIKEFNVPTFDAEKEKEKNIVDNVFGDIRQGLQDLINTISDAEKFQDEELGLLTEEIDDIKDSPIGFDCVNLFCPEKMEELLNKKGVGQSDVETFIKEKQKENVQKLQYKVNAQRNFEGDELSILARYRQQLIQSFQTRLQSINTDHVDSSLERIKRMVGDVFVTKGRLSNEILGAPIDCSFFNAIIAYSTKEGLSNVSSFFKEKRDAHIAYMNSILDEVTNTILLKAKFTVSISYNNNVSKIAESFYNVLLEIESSVKQDLREYFAQEKLVETIIQHYHNMVGEIESPLLTSYVGDNKYNDLHHEFIRLYKNLYYKLFPSGELNRKENGIKAWNKFREIIYNEKLS